MEKTFSVTLGKTINMGNFEFLRVDLGGSIKYLAEKCNEKILKEALVEEVYKDFNCYLEQFKANFHKEG